MNRGNKTQERQQQRREVEQFVPNASSSSKLLPLGGVAIEGHQTEALVQSDVEVGHVEADAVDRTGLARVRVLGVEHLHRLFLPHVPEPDKTVPGCAANQRHIVVRCQAVDRFVERLLPGPKSLKELLIRVDLGVKRVIFINKTHPKTYL